MDATTMERRDRDALLTPLLVGVILTAYIAVAAVQDVTGTFTPEGIAMSIPLTGIDAAVPIGVSGALVSATVDSATVAVGGLPLLSLIALLSSLVASTAQALTITVCLILLCRNLLRGIVFSRANTTIVRILATVMAVTAVVAHGGEVLAVNGALARAGVDPALYDSAPSLGFWLAFLSSFGLGALAVMLHRGERLQRDMEGLI